MSYYTVDKIKQIINDYHINVDNLREHRVDYNSIGVQSFDTQPKGNTISDVTCNEALSKVNENRFMDSIISDMKYLEDRLHRISGERNADIISMKMEGHNAIDISQVIGISRRTVDNVINIAAREISEVAKT